MRLRQEELRCSALFPQTLWQMPTCSLGPGMQGSVSVLPLDLADLSSVHTLSHNLVQQKTRLDMVICNAGVVRLCALYLHKGCSCSSPQLCGLCLHSA